MLNLFLSPSASQGDVEGLFGVGVSNAWFAWSTSDQGIFSTLSIHEQIFAACEEKGVYLDIQKLESSWTISRNIIQAWTSDDWMKYERENCH